MNQQFADARQFLLGSLLALAVVDTVQAAEPQGRPNIIVMMVDDMGFAGPSIAPYGNPNYRTPGMDRLAREGMLFTDFHSSGAICSATRAGLITGRYQQRAGIEAVIHPHATHPEHRKGLHETEVTFAELFKDAGYSTGLVGKWHLGYAAETPQYHPMNHGFDYFMGYVSGNIDYINHWGDHMQHDWWHGRKETKEAGYTTHLINKYALEFIQQNKDQPFCLYIAHESPHSPVQGPDDPIQRGPGATKRTTPHAEAMKQMILEMDKGVQQVRAKLVKLGLEKNTLFLFFSDNGDAPRTATGSPRFRGHKGSVYEGGTRVPAVAWWPGRIKAGTQAEDLSITLDVMPTILSVAGIDPPKQRPLDGIDLSPVLFEQKALPARPLFWADLSNNGSRSEALRDGPWKLVVQHPTAKPGTFANEAIELFNLTNDEGEKTNLAAQQPERVAEMLTRLKVWYADTQETASPQPGGWIPKPHGELPELLAASIHGSPDVDIAVPNGTYTLQLILYEGWRSRSADLVIEGKTVREKYDMFKEQGGNFDHGSVLRHTFTLTDGNIDIEINGPLHLGGLILSKAKGDSADRVAIVNSQADLDLKDVIKAINFGDTKDLNIGDIKFAAAAVNTTVDGVTNTARGDVHAGEFGQKLPQMQKEKAPNRANAKGKPNVVVIFTDDLGWTDLGCYGSNFYETPYIDRLANQGAIFRNAYAACNVCSPTRAALMTGKYPQRVGFTDWLNPDRPSGPNSAATALPASEVTIGEAFQQSGYRTGYIGKWHLGPQEHAMPKQQGFDWQMASCRHGYPSSYFFPFRKNTSGDVPDLEHGKPGDYLTDVLTTRAIGFMEETVKTDEKPFFLVLGHYAVHTPIEAPQPLVDKYTQKKQRLFGDGPVKTVAESGNSRTRVEQSDPVYAGMVERLDTNVGRVVAALEKLGVADNTIVLFTSDNGGESNQNRGIAPTSNLPLRAGKGWNYEGGIRVPTFMTWPGHIAAQEFDERVITMDIYPTLLELTELDAKPQQHVDGRSLVPLLEGKEKTVKRPFLAWRKPHQRGASRPSAAIIKDGWKLIHYLPAESTELYNLDDDPGEANDLAASEPGKSSELLNILIKWTEETEFKKPNAATAQTRPLTAKPNTSQQNTEPRKNTEFFNGKDLTGWKGGDGYWSVKDGAIVGHSEKNVPKNEFIWSDVEVKDFYLSVDVKLDPNDRNAGIQFRSKPVDAHGQALGYQADLGAGVWGKLYHEHGRGKLDWNDNAAGAVKPGEWNKYEILAVGHRIWTAINGKLCVGVEDPQGELSGTIAFQIHSGPPQTVRYRNPVLTHNPKLELAGLNEQELISKLPSAAEPTPDTSLDRLNKPAQPRSAGPFIVAEGLNVESFATQQLSNPCSIDVDDRGRVWVGEALNYRKQTRKAGDRILILEDTDGDGQADSTKVYYQNPDIDGVHGVAVLGNMAIVSVSDRILLLTDTDGDDKADKKKLLFMGKVIHPLNGQHDHAIHAVMFGPDGRLYFNFGNFNAELRSEDGSLVKDVFGNPVDNSRQPYQGGMVIRCELDGSRVEVLGHNFRNNWEVTVDSFGSMWQSDNDNGSSSCRVNFVMEYGNYGYSDQRTGADYLTKRTNIEATMQRQMWHQNDPGVVPNLLITGAGAPTGILVYEGSLLPEQFHGQMIHAEPGRNTVWAFPTQRDGAGYSAEIVHIARHDVDRDYRPCDVSVAPDGSLLIADWFDPVDCCHRTLNDAGRLFRVAPPGHVYSIPKYNYDTPQGAVETLRSPNQAARYKAWTALVGMKSDARSALQTMLNDSNPRFRARALWVLAAIDDTAHAAIELALGDESDDIRALALRIARRHQLPIEPVVKRLVGDKSALVRRECAVSLHRLDSAEAVRLWTELAVRYDGKDRWYLEALGIGEVGKETACLQAWQKKVGEKWKAAGNRDVVWRSRAPEAATLLADLLLDCEVPAAEHPRLLRALDFHDGHHKRAALATLLTSDPKHNPVAWLEAFQRATPEFLEAHPEILDRVGSVMLTSKGTVTFVELVARFDRRDMIGHLIDMTLAEGEKESGIRAVGQIIAFQQWDPIWKALADPDRAAPFIRALGYIDNEHAKNYLTGVVTNEAQPEATRLLAISSMGNMRTPAVELMHLVQQQKLPQEFLAPAIRALTLSPDPDTRMFAAEQQQQLVPVEDRWPLEKLLAAEPDPTKGFAAYQKGGCIKCHKIGNQGHEFGPDLSAIGTKLTSKQLFSAIQKPSETISLGYESVTVLTDDGVLASGFVAGETEETLTLRVPGGLQNEIPKTTIELRKRSDVSLMPKGIDAVLAPQELVDLVGWLATGKSAEAALSSAGRAGQSQGEDVGDSAALEGQTSAATGE